MECSAAKAFSNPHILKFLEDKPRFNNLSAVNETEKKVRDLMKWLIGECRGQALKEPLTQSKKFPINLDIRAFKLLKKLLRKEYSVTLVCHGIITKGSNYLCHVFGSEYGSTVKFNCSINWTFHNSYIYLNKEEKPTLPNPEAYKIFQVVKGLWEDPTYKDFTILAGEDQTPFRVHKAILVECPYFRTLFQSPFKEKEEACLHLKHSPEVVEALLKYLYFRPVSLEQLKPENENELSFYSDLLALSHELQETLLIEICTSYLNKLMEKMLIDDENFTDILSVGILYKLEELIIPCLKSAEKNSWGLELLESMLTKKNIVGLRKIASEKKLENVTNVILKKMDEFIEKES